MYVKKALSGKEHELFNHNDPVALATKIITTHNVNWTLLILMQLS